MRYLIVIFALSLVQLSAAGAQTTDQCRRMEAGPDRLACFDKLFPPDKKRVLPERDFRDITQEENAKLDKTFKSICKSC
jgi:hypothetical protein